jgi:2-polyprenyl-3-methyl-5-hydroxy-6-metoxy-1,4-benzoquinol methylase
MFHNLSVQDDSSIVTSESGQFDAVVSTKVIEHLYSPRLLPNFAREVLVDEGYLLITTPYHGYTKNFFLSVTGKWHKHHTSLSDGGHIKFFNRRNLSQLLAE